MARRIHSYVTINSALLTYHCERVPPVMAVNVVVESKLMMLLLKAPKVPPGYPLGRAAL
jgi:hypothetical protein